MTPPCEVLVVTKPQDIPMAPVDGKPTLVYWEICGLAQPIRMSLVLAGVDFVDVRIQAGSKNADDYKQVWSSKLPYLFSIMPFPSLPYFLDSNVALSQTNAILKYIGRTYGSKHPNGKEHSVDVALDQLADTDSLLTKLMYGSESLEEIEWAVRTKVPSLLSLWEPVFRTKDFLTGDAPTVADMRLYETLRKVRIMEEEVCKKSASSPIRVTAQLGEFWTEVQEGLCGGIIFSSVGGSIILSDFMHRIEAIPRIQEFLASDEYIARPLNNPDAMFK